MNPKLNLSLLQNPAIAASLTTSGRTDVSIRRFSGGEVAYNRTPLIDQAAEGDCTINTSEFLSSANLQEPVNPDDAIATSELS